MDSEFQDLELALKNLRPEGFSAAYLDRLTAAVEGRSQQTEPALQQVERALGAMMPLAPSADLSARCLSIVSRVPFPLDEKVVLFPGKSRSERKPGTHRPWWMAAAAVAMAGAFSATFVGREGSSSRAKEVASNDPISSSPARPQISSADYPSPASPGNFVPASTGTGVQEAKDEGVVWNRQGNPIRMVRVVYMDTVKLKDGNGKIVEVQRPRVDYLAVPEKVN
jgi:hypothetical protein